MSDAQPGRLHTIPLPKKIFYYLHLSRAGGHLVISISYFFFFFSLFWGVNCNVMEWFSIDRCNHFKRILLYSQAPMSKNACWIEMVTWQQTDIYPIIIKIYPNIEMVQQLLVVTDIKKAKQIPSEILVYWGADPEAVYGPFKGHSLYNGRGFLQKGVLKISLPFLGEVTKLWLVIVVPWRGRYVTFRSRVEVFLPPPSRKKWTLP